MVKKEAVEEDDVEAFLASLDPKCKRCPPQAVAKLLESRAIGCVTALLEGKIPHNRLDLRRDPLENGVLPLQYAAKFGFHEAIELFILRHGVYRREVAIDCALEASCDEWNRRKMEEESGGLLLSDLILWLPEWISDADHFNWWHTVKLLARTNDAGGDLEKKTYEYARDGQAAKLLWLLLASPDRLLSPTFLDTSFSLTVCFRSQYYPLRDFLTAQLAFVVADRWCYHDHDPQLIKSLEEKRSILTSSLLLLEVFQRAGTQLSNLIPMLLLQKEEQQLPSSPVAQQVQTVLLQGAGIPLASLNCPIISTPDSKIDYPYPSGPLKRHQSHAVRRRGYLAFLFQPAGVCRSEILDSEFSRAIEKLCYHPYLKEWNLHMSAFKLLFIFCLPELVEKMQCMLQLELKYDNPAKVIHPTYLAELCFIYITEGRIVEFTAALMAVRVLLQLDHPLSPQMSYHPLRNEHYTRPFMTSYCML